MPHQLLLVNPAKRKRKGGNRTKARRAKNKTQHVAGYYPNPIKRRRRRASSLSGLRRRFRRNPSPRGNMLAGVKHTVVNGAIGAAGGIAVDAMLKLAPLSLKTGPVGHMTRAGAAIALGMVGNALKLPFAGALAEGAMTIAFYGAAREYVTVPMGLSEYNDSDIAEMAGLGFMGATDALEDMGDGDDEMSMSDVGEFVPAYMQ